MKNLIRKSKGITLVSLVVTIIIILLTIGCSNDNENQNTQTVSNNYDEILTYFAEDKNITSDFLEYIKNNYSDDLINKLAESLKNNFMYSPSTSNSSFPLLSIGILSTMTSQTFCFNFVIKSSVVITSSAS